ncbi:MAG: hypothetical protein WD004_08225 [Actinomycetota bacterium]
MSAQPPTFSHTGYRYVLGYETDSFGIWDRNLPGSPPVQTFPRTTEGWAAAWARYAALEPSNIPVVGSGSEFPTSAPPGGSPSMGTSTGTKVLIGVAIAGAGLLIVGLLVAIALPTFLGARIRAQDRAGESQLRNGYAAALAYYTDDATFVGFDATVARSIEPSLNWTDGPAIGPGDVSIRGARRDSIVLVTLTESGKTLCIARTGMDTTFGQVDAMTATECTGDWPA